MERRFPIRPCPVCESRESVALFGQCFEQLSGVRLLDGYTVAICKHCGAGFADDIPPQAVFDAYYRDLSKYGGASSGNTKPAAIDPRLLDVAETIEPFIPERSTRILEIGCGCGQLLKILRDRGYHAASGVDPSPECVEDAASLYGVPAATGTIASIPETEERYEFLILIGVMEHIRDLDSALQHLERVLAPGALVYLEVPDASRYEPNQDAPFQEFSLEHINFFSRQSLINLMAAHGFRGVSSGNAVRRLHEGRCPAAYGVFRAAEAPVEIRQDTETEPGLRNYIQGCRAEDGRIGRLIDEAVPVGQKMIVWGVGAHTLRLVASHGLDIARVALFVDSNPKYQGQELCGVPVVSPRELRDGREPILISSRGFQREIHDQIRHTLRLSNRVIMLYEGESR